MAIKKEIKDDGETAKGDQKDAKESVCENLQKVKKKCRYYNRGYCKYKQKCKYVDPEHVCQEHLTMQKCENKECPRRHHRRCKWEESNGGCRRYQECEYVHGGDSFKETSNVKSAVVSNYPCAGCKGIWNNSTHVVPHQIANNKLFFCLNCNDWIQKKAFSSGARMDSF